EPSSPVTATPVPAAAPPAPAAVPAATGSVAIAPVAAAPPATVPPAPVPPVTASAVTVPLAPVPPVTARVSTGWLSGLRKGRRDSSGRQPGWGGWWWGLWKGRRDSSGRRLDWGGLVLLSGGAVTVVSGATLVDRPAGAGSAGGLVLIVAGLGMLGWFAGRARRVADPIVDLRLLRHRPVRAGAGVLVLFAAAYFGSMAVLPLFVQGVRGDPASLVGVIGIPAAITVGLVAQVATRLVDRFPARRIVLSGTGLGAVGGAMLLVATATDAGYPWIMAATVVLGAGSGATLMPTMTVALRDLDHAETPRGTTLLALVVQLSNALAGAAVAVTLSALVGRVMPGPGGGVPAMLALDDATRETLRPDLAAAVGATYLLPVLLLAGSWLIAYRAGKPPVWLSPRPRHR
ncbi:MFS transporter, partial [Actinoplanes philippinensis]|uniref:MFS transporter n=1 Tax=Actinoplanes philippinensis TaxID=35752 RepID=UPI0033F6E974